MSGLNWQEILSAFVVLFAVIDMAGLTPVIIDQRNQGVEIPPGRTALYSLAVFLIFLFLGNQLLRLFGVDVSSFAVAGSLVIFVVAVEMTFDVSLFKLKGPQGMAAIVPIVFPFIAGAASFTTLLSLRAEYALSNILVALLLNVGVIYLVIWKINILEKVLGAGGVYILRKFFGIILLAIAVKLFTSNLSSLLTTI